MTALSLDVDKLGDVLAWPPAEGLGCRRQAVRMVNEAGEVTARIYKAAHQFWAPWQRGALM